MREIMRREMAASERRDPTGGRAATTPRRDGSSSPLSERTQARPVLFSHGKGCPKMAKSELTASESIETNLAIVETAFSLIVVGESLSRVSTAQFVGLAYYTTTNGRGREGNGDFIPPPR